MAKNEVASYSLSANKLETPQGVDTYVLPKLCYTTTGQFTTEVPAGATAKGFTFDSGGNYSANATARVFVIKDNGVEILSVGSTTAGPGGISAAGSVIQGNPTGAPFAGKNLYLQSSGNTSAGVLEVSDVLGLGAVTALGTLPPGEFVFNSKTTNTAGATSLKFNGFSGTPGTLTNQYSVKFTNDLTNEVRIRSLGGLESSHGIGLHGANTYATAQYNTAGGFAGFVQNTDVGANRVQKNSTFTGGTGATAYTIDNIVRVLKDMGLMAA